ncbi:uncharacterized protein SOCE836_040410 [Sorangium cellulosum]|uniref:Uncharacterized protein n=1 Tax=Sorangium cellulosum TaxID=56 RepID=A0A4P2QPM9_SORCE|nr:uncharacterized protein SOCE836_040410 [Sorangium cellulosum]WCQ91280.1 hypothetical protein NQZ70_03996 [Sorangium sp. Soce836]
MAFLRAVAVMPRWSAAAWREIQRVALGSVGLGGGVLSRRGT